MSGSFLINGKPVNHKIRNRDTFLVMQNSDYQLFTESVEKELYLGNGENEQLRKKGLSLLERMGLSDYLQQHPASLSGGQKQRLCIAVACMKDTDVICFDEPTSGLDYTSMKNVSGIFTLTSWITFSFPVYENVTCSIQMSCRVMGFSSDTRESSPISKVLLTVFMEYWIDFN